MTDTSKIPASRLRQDTFDSVPENGSGNVISSGAVYKALEGKLDIAAVADRAKADADGNIIGKTYARISDVIFYEVTD